MIDDLDYVPPTDVRQPTDEDLSDWLDEDGCLTACEHEQWVEPDGHCPVCGAPSWLIVLGFV